MAEPEIPALDALCRAIMQDDAAAVTQHRKEFVSRNWPFVRMLDQLAHADYVASHFETAAQKLRLLEQLLPENGGVFIRRVNASLRAGQSGALEELATSTERLTHDSELFSAVEELVSHGRADTATTLIEVARRNERFSAAILMACRSRVLAKTGRLGEALRSLEVDAQVDTSEITVSRCRYLLLEQLLEFDMAQRISQHTALRWGEEHDLRHAFDQLMFTFDYDTAETLVSTFASQHPARKLVADTLGAQIGPARAALAAVLAKHGPASSNPAVIFEALSNAGTPPSRVLWGKLSLISFLRSGAITEADYIRFAWFLPNWELAPVRNRVLAAARQLCGDAPAVQRGWLQYLIAMSAYGDAALHCQTLLAGPVDEDTLFFVTQLLRLHHDATIPSFMDPGVYESLRTQLFACLPDTDAGFRCVMHDHFVMLGGPAQPWTTDALPAHDQAEGRGFRRLLAVTTGRLGRVCAIQPSPARMPLRPVLAISGQLRGFETAWHSLYRHLIEPTGAPLMMSVWDKSVNARGRHARRLERMLPDDVVQRLAPEERYTDAFEAAYPQTASLLFGETEVDPATLRDLVEPSGCKVLALETESERLLEQALHPHISPNMLKMYYKFARLHTLIQEAEWRSGEVFSHVIWARPDCEILQLSADDLRSCLGRQDVAWSSFITETSFGDYAMVLPRHAFSVLASIFPRVTMAGDARLLPWRPNRSPTPNERSSLDAFGGPDVLFDMLLAAGYMPVSRIPRMVVNLQGRTPGAQLVRERFAMEQAAKRAG